MRKTFFCSMAVRVSPMPLRSPTVIRPAPMAWSLRTRVLRVSLWVEPGGASALLKLGFRNKSLPFIELISSRSSALLTPVARSWVFTKATLVIRFLLTTGGVAVGGGLGRTSDSVVAVASVVAFTAGVAVGSRGAGVARAQASSRGDVSTIPPRPAVAFRNARRFITRSMLRIS